MLKILDILDITTLKKNKTLPMYKKRIGTKIFTSLFCKIMLNKIDNSGINWGIAKR